MESLMHFFLADENTTLQAYRGKPAPAPRTVEMPRFISRDVHIAGGAPLVSPAELGIGTDDEFAVRLDAPNEAQRLNGHVIMAFARAAVVDDDGSELGLLAAAFHQLVLRLPEVHAYLDSLPRHQAETMAGLRTGRGRPRSLPTGLSWVYTLDRLCEVHGYSVALAAKSLAKKAHLSPPTLRNMHSRLWHLADAFKTGVFVSGAHHKLTPLEWGQSPTTTMKVYQLE